MSAPLQCGLLRPGSLVPTRAHFTDAGYDLFACLTPDDSSIPLRQVEVAPGERILMNTGVSVACPVDTCFQIWPRSGLALKHGLDVLGGLVDSGYRGEVKVLLINHGAVPVSLQHGERIAQLVPVLLKFSPQLQLQLETVLGESDRDVRGFGSTH